METQTREQILATALTAREQEVMHYQINIDNYTLALAEIEKMSAEERVEMADFEQRLRELLLTEKAEQRKAKLMLTVIQKQVP